MNRNRYKKYIIIGLVIIALAAIGNLVGDKPEAGTVVTELTQAQKDSIANAKLIAKGKTNAIVNLRTLVRQQMHNPKSFDVIDQNVVQTGDSTLVVVLTYTGTNLMGGVAKQTIQAEADLYGNILKIYQ